MNDIDDVQLISLVQQSEFLYNRDHKFYSDAGRKKACWKRIGEAMGGLQPVICSRRWTGLRDRFVREKRRLNSLAAAGVKNTRTWHMMEPLAFLQDYITHKRHIPRSVISLEPTSIFLNTPVTERVLPVSLTSALKDEDLSQIQMESPPESGSFSPLFSSASLLSNDIQSSAIQQGTNNKRKATKGNPTDSAWQEACKRFNYVCERAIGKKPIDSFGLVVSDFMADLDPDYRADAIARISALMAEIKREEISKKSIVVKEEYIME